MLCFQLADFLPSKTIPAMNRSRTAKRKHGSTSQKQSRARSVSLEEVEDEDSPRMVSERTQKAEHFVIEDKNEDEAVTQKASASSARKREGQVGSNFLGLRSTANIFFAVFHS
jgi:hypothetical protein